MLLRNIDYATKSFPKPHGYSKKLFLASEELFIKTKYTYNLLLPGFKSYLFHRRLST
uniref:Uncharacterized protein n=1 Tax=Rhizophora mucronata TaxID=61149 RepID=A0A2P2PUV8_RHIMU